MQLVFFRLHLMLHARIERFDVMATVTFFENLGLELNAASVFCVYVYQKRSSMHGAENIYLYI